MSIIFKSEAFKPIQLAVKGKSLETLYTFIFTCFYFCDIVQSVFFLNIFFVGELGFFVKIETF